MQYAAVCLCPAILFDKVMSLTDTPAIMNVTSVTKMLALMSYSNSARVVCFVHSSYFLKRNSLWLSWP